MAHTSSSLNRAINGIKIKTIAYCSAVEKINHHQLCKFLLSDRFHQSLAFRHEEYYAVWAVNHRANLSCDSGLPPLKFHSQDARGGQSDESGFPIRLSSNKLQLMGWTSDRMPLEALNITGWGQKRRTSWVNTEMQNKKGLISHRVELHSSFAAMFSPLLSQPSA